jgi:phytoene/squalene synthetase
MSVSQQSGANEAPAASGSSFYAAMRILPPRQREAMYAVYGFCRAVDDIADEAGPRPERLAGLDRWRRDIDRLYSDGGETELTEGLRGPVEAFGLEQADFLAVIDGMEMDTRRDIRAPDWQELDLYCDRVASAVGRLCVKIFGIDDGSGLPLAYHLGRALQMTNILRDLDEDAVRSPRLMAAVYRPMLDRLVSRGWSPPRHKLRHSTPLILWAVLRYGLL